MCFKSTLVDDRVAESGVRGTHPAQLRFGACAACVSFQSTPSQVVRREVAGEYFTMPFGPLAKGRDLVFAKTLSTTSSRIWGAAACARAMADVACGSSTKVVAVSRDADSTPHPPACG